MSEADRFRIATSLLHDGTTPWANLGLWQWPGQDYVSATIALADRHWQLAAPSPGARLLDAGCGHGASLRHWLSHDPTLQLTALECQPACLQRLVQDGRDPINARFDSLPLPAALPAGSQDVMLCVDAAYHARSLQDFARFAAQVLRPGGVLVFSTLLVDPAAPAATRLPLRAAGIPAGSQVSAEQLPAVLARAGLRLTDNLDLDAADDGVLAGFAAFTSRRARALTTRQRLSAGWLKIAMTGRLCERLSRQGQVRYALLRAVRED